MQSRTVNQRTIIIAASVTIAVLMAAYFLFTVSRGTSASRNVMQMNQMLQSGASADEMERFLKSLPPDQKPKGY